MVPPYSGQHSAEAGLRASTPSAAMSQMANCSLFRRFRACEFALGLCLIATQGPASRVSLEMFERARTLYERLGDRPEYLQVMFWLGTVHVIRGELPEGFAAC